MNNKEMIPDVCVNLLTGDSSRITKSNGCVEAETIEGIKCLEATFVPKEPWINLSKYDINNLITKGEHKYTDITLISLPRRIKKMFEKLNAENCININDIFYIQNSREFKNILQETIKYLSKNNIENSEITPHSIYFGKANLKNNTFNSKENVYIGMHLDSWEGKSINDRIFSRNRICINLGKESRYLLFYNISILQMASLMEIDVNNPRLDINSVYKTFAKHNKEIPIYRIEIKPYEAYVAPTEYIIHDGSSWNSMFPDINIVFRGKFFFKSFDVSKLIINLLKL